MNKTVVYTCISGQYDILKDPLFISKDVDYVCFTDQPFYSEVWQIKPIPEELNDLSQVKKQRCIKINPHKFLPEYDTSVWVDGNITPIGDMNDLISKLKWNKSSITIPRHPIRRCTYDEGNACIQLGKESREVVINQLNKYKQEGLPINVGMVQSGIIIRKHNDKNCILLMNKWWEELEANSCRDQLSFNYAAWKTKVVFNYVDKSIFNSIWFKYNGKHYCKSNSNTTKVYYSTPYNSNKNIGVYYNDTMNLLPNDDDYMVFVDGDTIFTTPDFGSLIEEVIKLNPTVDMFTCYTNRVGCKWQVHPNVDGSNNDMKYHMDFGKQLKLDNGTQVTDVTNNSPFSGMLFIIKKSAWDKIGGAKKTGMLGVDNDIHMNIRKHGMKLYRIDGLYVYHWYRGGNKNDISHLK